MNITGLGEKIVEKFIELKKIETVVDIYSLKNYKEELEGLEKMGKKLYAVANRTHEKALDFAKKYGVEKVYDKIEDMFTEAVIACEKAYIEIMEYPRADKAKIVYTETGKIDEIKEGATSNALQYELQNMEKSVRTGVNQIKPEYTVDVMEIMTKLRKE